MSTGSAHFQEHSFRTTSRLNHQNYYLHIINIKILFYSHKRSHFETQTSLLVSKAMSLPSMNITFQIWDGRKCSILWQHDQQLADFILALARRGINVDDYIFFACGEQLNLTDSKAFNSQKQLLDSTYIILSPKPAHSDGHVR